MSDTTTQVNAPISDKQQFDLISAQLYASNGFRTLSGENQTRRIVAFNKKTTIIPYKHRFSDVRDDIRGGRDIPADNVGQSACTR